MEDGDEGSNQERKSGGEGPEPTYTANFMNGEDGERGLGGPLEQYGWDENVTLAPLLWEDMATQPIFDFS